MDMSSNSHASLISAKQGWAPGFQSTSKSHLWRTLFPQKVLFLRVQTADAHRVILLRPVTLAHNLLTNPMKNYAYARSCSGSRVPEDLTRGLIPHPAPVPFGTSLTSRNFRFHCSPFQVFSVPSSIVTPVSCPLHVLCSTHTTFFVPSDPMHTIHSAQTIKVPCVMYVPAI